MRIKLTEGGNLIVNGKNGEKQATKLLTREMGPELFEEFKGILKEFLLDFESSFEAETGMHFWDDHTLIEKGEIFSGSTRTFFTKDWDTYSTFKPKVGDMDVQIPDYVNQGGVFHKFLMDHQGEQFGPFILYGSKDKDTNNQGHSLITTIDEKFWPFGGEYVQIDWEYTAWDENGRPNEWVNIAHYSSWEDIENNIKGAFVKILIRATVDVLAERPDLLDPSVVWTSPKKKGKVLTHQYYNAKGDVLGTPRMKKFSVDGGLQTVIIDNQDGTYSKPSKPAERPRSYNSQDVFEYIFKRAPEGDEMRNLLSFVRYCKMINRELDPNILKTKLFKRFIKYLWESYSQELSRDIEEDTNWKNTAVEKFLELVPVADTPENREFMEQKRANYIETNGSGSTLIESRRRLREGVTPDGNFIEVYHTSKSSDLFKYFFQDKVELGNNAGSMYGMALYAVIDSPFEGMADIGYSEKMHERLYGNYCFKFSIPTEEVFFFIYEDFMKTTLGRETNATRQNFISLQVAHFDLPQSIVDKVDLLTPEEGNEFNAQQAMRFFQLMAREYYQDSRGALRTPCAGFVYKGKNDGRTYVGWNVKALDPEAYTLDLGKTWIKCDKNSPEYKEYISNNSRRYSKRDDVVVNRIFDGNKTPEKEGVYRLFMKFNSADDESGTMAQGSFYNIKIHDDKTIDATFKSNLPQVDGGKHFYNLRKHDELMGALNELGYRFGVFNAGLKVGSISKESDMRTVPAEFWPEKVTGGFKVSGCVLNKETFAPLSEFEEGTLYLSKCVIEEDVFEGWNVIPVHDEEKPEQWNCTPNEEVWNKLRAKYEWMEYVLKEPGDFKQKRTRVQIAQDKLDDLLKKMKEIQDEMEVADEKTKAKLAKTLSKTINDVEKQKATVEKWLNAAAESEAKEKERFNNIQRSWRDSIERVKSMR